MSRPATTATRRVRERPAVVISLTATLLLATACGAPAPGSVPASPAASTVAEAPVRTAAEPAPVLPDIPLRKATPAPPPREPAPPRFLRVEGTSIAVEVVEVGVGPDNAMVIPDSFYQAGWYRYGTVPGEKEGSAVIAAHVDTLTDVAPFAELKRLDAGARVTVEQADGGVLEYTVARVESVDKGDLDGGTLFRRDGPPELKLVTCGGRWLDERQDYSDNVIVTAVPR